ncbi:rab-like protein 2A [Trematomus bernacchii]|uniref:rab-like protein 2A n=1 Tax=Trematomus bernacchii TaxID=40690 RepID=UPI00146E45D3|nr:rab-like protein 2A [Trematomus bernacchii]
MHIKRTRKKECDAKKGYICNSVLFTPLVANKIDADLKVTQRSFNFGKKQGIPFYFVSAADGTNVVKMFREMITRAVEYKQNPSDFMDEVLQELENFDLEEKEDPEADEVGLKTESPELE